MLITSGHERVKRKNASRFFLWFWYSWIARELYCFLYRVTLRVITSLFARSFFCSGEQ